MTQYIFEREDFAIFVKAETFSEAVEEASERMGALPEGVWMQGIDATSFWWAEA